MTDSVDSDSDSDSDCSFRELKNCVGNFTALLSDNVEDSNCKEISELLDDLVLTVINDILDIRRFNDSKNIIESPDDHLDTVLWVPEILGKVKEEIVASNKTTICLFCGNVAVDALDWWMFELLEKG